MMMYLYNMPICCNLYIHDNQLYDYIKMYIHDYQLYDYIQNVHIMIIRDMIIYMHYICQDHHAHKLAI